MYPHNCLFWLSTGFRFCKLRNVISYGAKMVVKWPIIPIIVPSPISKFYGIQKEYKTQKVAKAKRTKKKEKRRGKNSEGAIAKSLQILAKAHAPNLFIIQLHFAEYR